MHTDALTGGRTMSRRLDPTRQESGQLKEIASRLKRLSYRDMQTLADKIFNELPETYADMSRMTLANAVLSVADALGGTEVPDVVTR